MRGYKVADTLEALEPAYNYLHRQRENILNVDGFIMDINAWYINELLKEKFGKQYDLLEQIEEEVHHARITRGDEDLSDEEELRLLQAGTMIYIFRKQLWLRDELPYPLLLWMQFLGRRRVDEGYKNEILMMDFNPIDF